MAQKKAIKRIPEWKRFTVYESSVCQGGFNEGKGWKALAESLERAAKKAGLWAVRRYHSPTFWDLCQHPEGEPPDVLKQPTQKQLVAFCKFLSQAVLPAGGTVIRAFRETKESPVQSVVISDVESKLRDGKELIGRLGKLVDDKQKNLDSTRQELLEAIQEQSERLAFLREHGDKNVDWLSESGLKGDAE